MAATKTRKRGERTPQRLTYGAVTDNAPEYGPDGLIQDRVHFEGGGLKGYLSQPRNLPAENDQFHGYIEMPRLVLHVEGLTLDEMRASFATVIEIAETAQPVFAAKKHFHTAERGT